MTSPAVIRKRLERAHRALPGWDVDAVLIPTGDPHLSEYAPPDWDLRGYLTGFSGSAGTLLLSARRALLRVDSRYWEQAERQCAATGIEVCRAGAPGVPGPAAWLAAELPAGATLGLDFRTIPAAPLERLRKPLGAAGIALVDLGGRAFSLWPRRPAPAAGPARLFMNGQDPVRDKLSRVRAELAQRGADWLFLASLDDIAWLLDLRADDLPHTPVLTAYLLLGRERARLYVAAGRIPAAPRAALAEAGVTLADPARLEPELSRLKGPVWLDPERVSAHHERLLVARPDARLLRLTQPTTILKSRKSAAELALIRATMIEDGVALCELLSWLAACQEEGRALDERDVVRRLRAERERRPGFLDDSFATIAAFGANAALPHYTPGRDPAPLRGDSLLLLDSGGHYEGGTTDLTRVVLWGRASAARRRDYSAVLRAHIALARARFPAGINGSRLDPLARRPLWEIGADYGHGTGHGVGFVLSVHEGPVSISPRADGPDSGVVPGLVLSNEPGLYRRGRWGVRLENLVTPAPAPSRPGQMGRFLVFETLSLCPFEPRLIDRRALNAAELSWVNAYHERVRAALSGRLSPRAEAWLTAVTAPL